MSLHTPLEVSNDSVSDNSVKNDSVRDDSVGDDSVDDAVTATTKPRGGGNGDMLP